MSIDFLFLNPYQGQTLIGFIFKFMHRMGLFFTGQLPFEQLASDEIQVLVLMGIAISSALLGSFLVLRRLTMLANALSHTILMGIVLAYFLTSSFHLHDHGEMMAPMGALLLASLATGCLTVFLTEFLTQVCRLQEDASIGLVFTSFFALGVVLVTVLTRDAHIGIEAVMGNADALHPSDLSWVFLITVLNIFFIFLFFKEFKLTTFDPYLALAMGFSPLFFNYLLMTQVSLTTITSFRAVGVLLVLAFMTAPPLAARLLTHHLSSLLMWAVGLGCLSAFVGVALTRHLLTVYGMALSTGGVVVSLLLLLYLVVAFMTHLTQTLTLKNGIF